MTGNGNSNDDKIEDYLLGAGGDKERELLVEVTNDGKSTGIEVEGIEKDIKAGDVHDQIEKAAKMSRTKSKSEVVNNTNDGESTRTVAEHIKMILRQIKE